MKIAIVRLSALGDIIQSAIVLQFIKKFQPKAQIHWYVDAKFQGILEAHPLIDKLFVLPLKQIKILEIFKVLARAKRNDYDLVIDPQGLIKSALISRILSVNNFGFDKNSIKESFAANFYNQKFYCNYNENVYFRYLSLICFVFNESFEPKDILLKEPIFRANEKISQNLKARLKALFNKDLNLKNNDKTVVHSNLESVNEPDFKLILIHPHASVANKIYPKERLAILINLIANLDESLKIGLSWGDEKERTFNEEVLKLSGAKNAFCLPRVNLQGLIALTALSTLVIGNDSGPTHLAFAMDKPSITIFGATPSQRNAYETPINKVIDADKKINDAKNLDRTDFCIQNVDEDAIFSLVKELLNSNLKNEL